MGGAACYVIISGQTLTGSILGIYNTLTYGGIKLSENERGEILDYLRSVKEGTGLFVVDVNKLNTNTTKVNTIGAQIVGDLNALCDTANNPGMGHEEKEEMANFFAEKNKEGEKWLKFLMHKAEKEVY